MQLTPRYDGPPTLRLELPLGDVSVPMVRQRRRLAAVLESLDEAAWAAPSRCEGWSVRDVVSHLVGTNRFWAASMSSGLSGSPTRFLTAFDPVATPAAMVAATRELGPAEVGAQFADSVEALAAVFADGVDEDGWLAMAEAPQGHVELRAVVLHALWDAWTHERDILLPLGREQVVEDDEVVASLAYAAAIGPALLAAGGSTRRGAVAVEAVRPEASFVVEAGETVVVRPSREVEVDVDVTLRGDAVDLVEGLTLRAPLEHGAAPDQSWLLGGLATAFDNAAAIG